MVAEAAGEAEVQHRDGDEEPAAGADVVDLAAERLLRSSRDAGGRQQVGEAGAEGFGNILSGSLERSNVDITEELVNLITAQRNFQASAKAIETTTTLTQTIINIRG